MTRLSKTDYFMEIARVVAKRSTCARRAVGCVLVNGLDQIVATGYNGRHRGAPNCIEQMRCPGAMARSGERLDVCEAIHAEQNALMQCADVSALVVCYVTTAPCVHCVKMLLNTSCRAIVYDEPYAGSGLHLWSGQVGRPDDGAIVRRVAYQVCNAPTVA